MLELETRKLICRDCGRSFRSAFQAFAATARYGTVPPHRPPEKWKSSSAQLIVFRNFNNYRLLVKVMCS